MPPKAGFGQGLDSKCPRKFNWAWLTAALELRPVHGPCAGLGGRRRRPTPVPQSHSSVWRGQGGLMVLVSNGLAFAAAALC